MLLTSALLLTQLMPAGPGIDPPVYSGRERQLSVRPPRIEAEIQVDGELTEAPWSQAAVLTGFSQYAPTDGLAAADSTQVLVWYSPGAIHFGVRAFESHGAASTTLADRDHIFGDDNIQIMLGTFHDGRQALMFAVNPRGVQADGALVEGRNTGAGGSFINSATVGREQADLSPDFVFQSRGRVTEWGYEVEIRIPFKSLRYQPAAEQSWNLNVVRQVKHSGFEDSWVPALRARPSFLNQAGELTGLHDLHRGLVMDLNPEVTQAVAGAPGTTGYDYTAGKIQLGGNVRWGISNSLALNGTVHPDYSQVESDAGQLAFDPRQALFFPEKRPFFLEGNELFAVPSNLIYTRRIVQPVAAVKLTGNAHGTNIGFLSAVDGQFASASGADNPVINIVRLQRNLGARSRIGVAYTDRVDGGNFNRVGDVDGRIVFGGIYSIGFQGAISHTRRNGATTTAPLWASSFNIRGRKFGLSSTFSGIHNAFRTTSGFIGRAGVVHANIDPSWTLNLARGSLVERFTLDLLWDGTWQYQKFVHGRGVQDDKRHLRANASLRGGWQVGLAALSETFGYDSLLYANYRIEVPAAAGGGALDTIPFTGRPRIPNTDWAISASTPQWRHFSANAFYLWGHDENFFEWQTGDVIFATLGISYRPTDRLRTELSYNWQQVNRRFDGSLVNVGRVPRLKLEYQVSRPFFVRIIGQYQAEKTDSLRDDGRTNGTILFVQPGGAVVRSTPSSSNAFHADVLLSYQPIPGTVILAGYGSNMVSQREFGIRDLARTDDAFFAKVSWLFRL